MNYTQRKVDRYKDDRMTISTVLTETGGKRPYKTAIRHKEFNDGNWIVLGLCKTKAEAKAFHENMVEVLREDTMQDCLDVLEVKVYRRNKTEG